MSTIEARDFDKESTGHLETKYDDNQFKSLLPTEFVLHKLNSVEEACLDKQEAFFEEFSRRVTHQENIDEKIPNVSTENASILPPTFVPSLFSPFDEEGELETRPPKRQRDTSTSQPTENEFVLPSGDLHPTFDPSLFSPFDEEGELEPSLAKRKLDTSTSQPTENECVLLSGDLHPTFDPSVLLSLDKFNNTKGKPFTPEENQKLIDFASQFPQGAKIPWSTFNLLGRTSRQCADKWYNILSIKIASTTKVKTFTPEENRMLIEFANQFPQGAEIPWSTFNLPGRTSRQCSRKWYKISSRKNISSSKGKHFTNEEDQMIIEFANQFPQGAKIPWSTFNLPGRTNKQCISRWYKISSKKNG